MTNRVLQFMTALVLVVSSATGPRVAQAAIPTFEPESISDFRAALKQHARRSRQALRVDVTTYRAYRFLDPQMVIVGVATAITVDAQGRVHVVQAHGEPMSGHLNATHTEYSHVLLPANVSPPK
jgi:hypothetical protein